MKKTTYFPKNIKKPFSLINPANSLTEQQILCTEIKTTNFQPGRIAFSTKDGRPYSHDPSSSKLLQDWMAATNIKIDFLEPSVHPEDRFVFNNMVNRPIKKKNNNSKNNSKNERSISSSLNQNSMTSLQKMEIYQPPKKVTELSSSNTKDEHYYEELVRNTYYYGVSDFAVGGRCKCHGHASRCVDDPNTGKTMCVCRHNTSGTDCGKCKKFHHDKPWRAATKESPYQCERKCYLCLIFCYLCVNFQEARLAQW